MASDGSLDTGARASTLPEEVQTYLRGDQLAEKVGETVLLCAVGEDSWPQMALLSVGEIIAVSDTEVRLTLRQTTRTARGLIQSGRGLILLVIDGLIYKIRLTCEVAKQPAEASGEQVFFVATVDDVRADEVGYAEVTNGLQYRLPYPSEVLPRWETQVGLLKGVAAV